MTVKTVTRIDQNPTMDRGESMEFEFVTGEDVVVIRVRKEHGTPAIPEPVTVESFAPIPEFLAAVYPIIAALAPEGGEDG